MTAHVCVKHCSVEVTEGTQKSAFYHDYDTLSSLTHYPP